MSFPIRISRAGFELIKSFEGYRERASQLPDGRWTVGYGHVRSAREGVRVSKRDAAALLIYDLKQIEAQLKECVFTTLNQNEHDALVSFVFNISPGLFRESDVLRRLNAGDHIGAADGFEAWRKARINGHVVVVDALIRRRAAEKALFLEHPDGRPTASTPIVTPQLDASKTMRSKADDGVLESAAASKAALSLDEAEVQRQDDTIAKMTSALEALANGTPETDTQQEKAKTPLEAAAKVAQQIENLFEETPVKPHTSETPTETVAEDVLQSEESVSMDPSDVAQDEPAVEKAPVVSRPLLSPDPAIKTAVPEENSEVASMDAWDLSRSLEEDVSITADIDTSVELAEENRPETKPTQKEQPLAKKSYFIDDAAEPEPFDFDSINWEEADVGEVTPTWGHLLWWPALGLSILAIIIGAVNFYSASETNADGFMFGPLMIACGGILTLMSAYFLMKKRGFKLKEAN